MTEKKYRLVISVLVATAMITTGLTPILQAATGGSSGPKVIKAEIPEFEQTSPELPIEDIIPDLPPEYDTSGTELFIEGFVTGFGQFTPANNAGDGDWTWNSNGWVDWNQTNFTDTEDDTLTATIDLTNVDPACVSGVWLLFEYWGDGGTFRLEIDGTSIGTYTGGVKTTATVDLTAYIGASHTLGFHVIGTPSRNFSIDNVIVYVPSYNTDIYIEDIDGLYIDGSHIEVIDFVNGGRYQKLPSYIIAKVRNQGTEDIVGADFHLQIYREMPLEYINYKCWDMETCFLISWDVFSWDGDQATWYWTEKRSHSPTHSYRCAPDYLDTYEFDSWDSLIMHDWFKLPDAIEIGGLRYPVTGAYLSFWHWCQGEITGGAETGYEVPVDYGQVFINTPTASTPVTPEIYDTGRKWEWWDPYYGTDPRDTDGRDPIDLTPWLGQNIKVNFTWISDDYLNYEGWYIDDVCIVLTLQSAQPLVDQGYAYVDIPAGQTVNVSFPLKYTFEDGYYFFQIYSDYEDCNPDNHGLGHGYADEINWTIWFGDVCDAAILGVVVAPEFETDYTCGPANPVEVPITVTVKNNGTLGPEDIGPIPVKVQVFHKLKKVLVEEDFEEGEDSLNDWMLAFSSYDFTGPTFIEHVTNYDANTGQYALAYFTEGPNTNRYYIDGMNQGIFTPSFNVPPAYAKHVWFDYAAKWNMAPHPFGGAWATQRWNYRYSIYYTGYVYGWDAWAPGILDDFANAFLFGFPTSRLGYTIFNNNGMHTTPASAPTFMDRWNNPKVFISSPYRWYYVNQLHEFHGWYPAYPDWVDVDYKPMDIFHIDIKDWINVYKGMGYLNMDMRLGWLMSTAEYGIYGYYSPNYNSAFPAWSGLMVDDVSIYYDYAGAKVWEMTKTIELKPGETGQLTFRWNATDFCDYIIVATVDLDCDMDPTNNEKDAETRIYTTIYEEPYEYKWKQEDNTFGLPDNWHVVEECSICPTNHFWWNGVESYNGYEPNTHDVLIINRGFNTTEQEPYLEIDFDTKYLLETEYDYGYVEISNDTFYWYEEPAGDPGWRLNTKGIWWIVAEDGEGNSGIFTGQNPSWPEFDHVSLQITPGTVLVEEMTGTAMVIDSSFFSTPISVRFKMYSDSGVCWKGWFIDNVNISYAGTDGMHWHEFLDTMEIPEFTAANWLHMKWYSGCHWHETSTFGLPHTSPDGKWFWNGVPVLGNTYYLDVDEKLVIEYDLTHAYEAILTFEYNYSFSQTYDLFTSTYTYDYGYVEISTDGGKTWDLIKIYGGTYGDGLNSGNAWKKRTIDISKYAGGDKPILIRFRFVDDSGYDPFTGAPTVSYGWLIDNISIIGKVDYIAPTASHSIDPATPNGCNGWYKSDVTITLTANDNTGIKAIYYRIDGGSWQVYTKPFKVTTDGNHKVEYYAEDIVGNTSPVGTITFKIDKTAPTVTITAPQAGYIYLFGRQLFKNPLGGTLIIGGIYFEATASDATSGVDYVSFNINGYTYDDASAPYKIWWHKFDLMPTKYTLTVSAYDEACNKAADQTLSFTHWL